MPGNSALTGRLKFKGADALYIESGALRAVITVRGSKMVSLIDKVSGRELLLQCAGDTLRQGGYDSDYNVLDVCGFDEMFPTIDACFYERDPWKGAALPDHGEVWGLDWECSESDGEIEAQVQGVRLPYRLSKRLHFIAEDRLRIDYTLENLSPFKMDYVWAAHAMFALEDDSVLLLPDNQCKATLTYSHGGRIGRYGDHIPLGEVYRTLGRDGLAAVLPGRTYMDKFYIDDRVTPGRCSIAYPTEGRACMLNFPEQAVPYLGVLLSNGLHIGNCAILEPCTAAFDRPDRARAFDMYSAIEAKGRAEWHLELAVGAI